MSLYVRYKIVWNWSTLIAWIKQRILHDGRQRLTALKTLPFNKRHDLQTTLHNVIILSPKDR